MENLRRLRKKVDGIDEQILRLLSQRAEICRSIGLVKDKHGFPIKDFPRENNVYAHIKEKAMELGLDPSHVEAIYCQIVNMCSAIQASKNARNENKMEN